MSFTFDYQLYALMFTAGSLLTIGDLSMKQWIKTSGGNFFTHPLIYIIGMVAYIVGLTLFAFSLKKENIAVATTIVIFFNILTVLIVGRYLFSESFSPYHYIGIALGLLAIVAFELAG